MVYADSSKDGSTVRRYGTVRLNCCQEVRYAFLVMVRYVFFVMVRHVGTLFEFKIPDIFCLQRQKTAKVDAKCVN